MTATPAEPLAPPTARLYRAEVRPNTQEPDPQAERVQHDARIHFGRVGQVRSARIYLIEAPLTEEQARAVAGELLADNVNQQYFLGNAPTTDDGSEVTIEVHYQPGVMDP